MSMDTFRKWLISLTAFYILLSATHLYGPWFDIFGYLFMIIIWMFTLIT